MNIKVSNKAKKQIIKKKKKKKKRCNIYFRVTSFRIITCAFIPFLMCTPQKDLKSSTSNIFGNLRCQFIFKFLNFTLIF